jgi:hypothetical protein
VDHFNGRWTQHFTEAQVAAFVAVGFYRVTEQGVDYFRKKVIYNQLPQDEIEDVMSPDDIIMGKDEVIVSIDALDGSISIESGDAYVGPIDGNSQLAEKILTSCF